VALAHPTRLSVLEALAQEGPLTATQAGVLLGESAGTMSWHLRVLARHGFVTEANGSSGRRRPWMLTALGTRWDPDPQSDAERAAADTLSVVVLDRVIGQLRAWLAGKHRAPRVWQRAAVLTDWTLYLTPNETEQLDHQIHALFEGFGERLAHPDRRPADAVAVRALVSMHPQVPVSGS
jgi:DNA-binding transcriptional ArsR family regulator